MTDLCDLEPTDEGSLIEAALDACTTPEERVEFLRNQNAVLRAANIDLTKALDEAVVDFHNLGAHAEADALERRVSPF